MAYKIGLISDTHMPQRWNELHETLPEIFQGVNLITHAGDLGELWVLDKAILVLPASVGALFQYLSVTYHFDNIARGVIDTRDLLLSTQQLLHEGRLRRMTTVAGRGRPAGSNSGQLLTVRGFSVEGEPFSVFQ